MNKAQQSNEAIPAFNQWSLTIENNYTNGSKNRKPLKKPIDVNGLVTIGQSEITHGLIKAIEIANGHFKTSVPNSFL